MLELLEEMAHLSFKDAESPEGEAYLEGRLHAYGELLLLLRIFEEGLL
jgi:hypothetical protein